MGFAVTLGVYAGLFILSKLLANAAPKVEEGRPSDSTVKPPEGTPMSLWWGYVKFTTPSLVWNTTRFKDEEFDAWHMDMVFILGIPMEGYGSLGATDIIFDKMFVNGEPMTPTSVFNNDTFEVRIDSSSTEFTDPDVTHVRVYDSENGVYGVLVCEFGTPSKGRNSLLGSEMFVFYGGNPDHWPRYEGQTKISLVGRAQVHPDPLIERRDSFEYTKLSLDPTGSVPAIEFSLACKTTHDFGGGLPLVKSLPIGDANPAAVIFDVLVSKWGKLGFSPSNIDLASFAAVGETLFEERHGFSYILSETVNAQDFLLDVLKQIDGVLYEDVLTRKLVLSLTRPDYVVGSLPEFSEYNVSEVMSFSTSTFDETYNEVRVVYVDRYKDFKEATAIAQDMANLTSQGGRIRSVTRQYIGVSTEELAAKLAARDLREVSVPLASLQFKVNRDAWTLRPNQCFKFSWAEFAGMSESVFRVVKIDEGTLEDSRLVITALQDIFSVTEGLMTPPEIMPIADPAPRAIERRIFTEAPRWFLRKAVSRGINSDIDIPRTYFLGARPEVSSNMHLLRITDDDQEDERTFLTTDRDPINYVYIHGVVETAYSRTAEPYDTATGLRITLDLHSYLPNFTATPAEIAKGKRSIVYVGGEIMAFETLTFISGTTWRLDDVWRGLLDTVPVAHAVGEPVFILSYNNEFVGDFLTGNRRDVRDYPLLYAAMLPLTNGRWMQFSNDAVELDSIVPRGRTLLPYPAADIEIEGTKGTSRREEEGFALSWARRNMDYVDIIRGDDPSHIVTTTQYVVIAKKIGPVGLVGAEQIIGIATSADEVLEVAASAAGHGTLAVFPRTVDLSTNLTNWQDPELPVEFPCWRNLLANCRFSDTFASNVTQPWVIVAGEATRRNTVYPLGGTGWFVSHSNDGESANIDMYQDVFLDDWHPLNMSALLTFYRRRPGDVDTDDSLTVDLIAFDASGTQLAIDTHGPTTPPNFWTYHALNLTLLPTTTRKLRVRVRMTSLDEPPAQPDAAVAEFALRVGQIGTGFISNNDFDTDLSSWTTASGTFTRQTAVPYTGTSAVGGYARGGTGTSNEIYQDFSLPTGFEHGTVVLEYAQGDEGGADNDLGYAQLDARSGGGTVLASANSPAIKAVTTPSTWARRRVVLENIPVGTATIRIRLIATRTAAGTADACFDDIRVHIFKELNPDYRLDLSVTKPPSTRFPRTRSAWYDAYPSVPPPDMMLYDGERLVGDVGIEANLGTPTTPYLGKLIGPYDGDHDTWSTSAYDFRPGCQSLDAIDDGAGYFANFAQGEAFTIVVVVRPGHGNTTTRRICGRIDGSTGGWCLEYLATNRFQARIRSGATQWVASPTTVALPGGLYCVQMTYDPVANQLRCSVNDDVGVSTVVTAGVSLKASNDLVFRIGRAESTDVLFNGQVARLYGWRTAYANFMASMNTYGDRPQGVTQTMTTSQTGQLMVALGDDFDGVTYAVYNPGLIPLGRAQGDWGYVLPAQVENNCTSRDLTDATAYPATSGGAALQRTGVVTPTGEGNGVRITAAVGDGMRVANVPVGAGTTVHVYFFARTLNLVPGPGTGHITVRLENTSGVLKGTQDVVIGPSWEIYDVVFTTWDDSTANMQIEFVRHATGPQEWDMGGPIVINQDATVQYVLPYNDLITQHHMEVNLSGITQQFNHEGEIYVEGTALSTAGPSAAGLAVETNSGSNNDRRLYTISNASGSFAHYNATGTSSTGTSGAPTWSLEWVARARWNRVGLLDSATSWARSITNGTASSARAATFTASTTPATELDLTGGVNGIVRRLILFAREVILGQAV
jgi:hypothetical protein